MPLQPSPTQRFSVSDVMYGTSDCRRQWWLSRLWDSKRPTMPFFIGDIVHKGLEIFYTYQMSNAAVESDVIFQTETYAKKQIRYLEESLGDLFPSYEDEIHEAAIRSCQVVRNYLEYDRDFPLPGRVVDVEKKFALPIGDIIPIGGFTLSGRIDLVIEDDLGIWIVDHKTSGNGFDDRGIDLDEQVTAYLWAASRIYRDKPLRGIIFNSIRSTPPEAPVLLNSRGAVKISKSKSQSTSYPKYLEAIREHGLYEEDYRDILDYFKFSGWSLFFNRYKTRRNEDELRNFESRLYAKIQDLDRISSDPQLWAYPSPSIYRCPKCQFLTVCKGMEDGSDWEGMLEGTFVKYLR